MRFCTLNKGIVHAMRFLAATATRAVSHHTITFVARPDAATVLLATIAVCHLLPHLVLLQWNHVVDRFFLRVVAVHALTV